MAVITSADVEWASERANGRPVGIPIRRPKVDLANADLVKADAGVGEPGRWIVPGDPIFSHFLSALSAAFPNGEDFFVESVRNFREEVASDPGLKARVKGFIGQEAMHGREHRAVNRRLGELGYPTARQDEALLAAAKRLQKLSPVLQLAVTAASEHFTAVLANAVLGDEQTRETLFPSEELELLITWHALEELEHKDVAFDVLIRVDDGYLVRAAGLGLAALGFGGAILRGYALALLEDRRHIDRAARRRNRWNFKNQRMVGLRTLADVLVYLRPGFHPADVQTDALVSEWRSRLADSTTSPSQSRN